ncbi:MAG TPA: GNAT family N-acetyltransferase [Epulopiscium sp.]|nr:GNAT family N-acetyltransferase [Candidatus Epulonipiscium sp.]
MEFKIATKENVHAIMEIIQKAQTYLKEQGINQWQNNYPNSETINNDIQNNNGYILIKDNVIIGTVAVIVGPDKTYKSIYNGEWITDGKYTVIHRMAVNPDYHGLGLATKIIKQVEEMCKSKGIPSMKVDTHKENRLMQKVLLKSGFIYCGIIYLEDGNERMAFEKVIKV